MSASWEEQEQFHLFELRQYYKPTDCDLCKGLLVGLIKQGLQCTRCSYNVHERCRDKINQKCQQTLNIASHRENGAKFSPAPSLPNESSECNFCLIILT